MADKVIKLAPPVVGVVAGQYATCDLTIGPRYHMLDIVVTGVKTSAQVALSELLGLIRIKINGTTVREILAEELDQYNQNMSANYAALAYNVTAANTYYEALANGDNIEWHLPVMFAEPFRKSYAATEVAAWPTRFTDSARIVDLQSFQVEIECLNTANVTLQSIRIYAETDNVMGTLKNGVPQLYGSRWQRLTVPKTAAGDLPITTIQRKGVLQGINLIAATDQFTDVRVERDGAIVREITKPVNDAALTRRDYVEAEFVDTRLDLVFDYTDLPTDALNLNTAKQFEVKPTMTGTTDDYIICLVQTFDSLV